MPNENTLKSEIDRLRRAGVTLPKSTTRAVEYVGDALTTAKTSSPITNLARITGASKGEDSASSANRELANEFRSRRFASARKKLASTSAGGDVFAALPRWYDPMEFWDMTGLPWNVADEGHRHKLHKWLRLYYDTHPLVSLLVDIFTRFPLAGMTLQCKDSALTGFYEDLFLDKLNYPQFLTDLGGEYWKVGEAFPYAAFEDNLGVWEFEELLNPEDIVIENIPFLNARHIKVQPPEYLKRLASTKSPAKEYALLEKKYPELIDYIKRGEPFPISDALVKQVAFKTNPWADHGTPILLRGLRVLIHEEKLRASQDAIAERLYSPLILAKLGIQDLGADIGPWIPGPDDLSALRDDLDIALASDFRLIVHHFGLDIESVFGREQVPSLDSDFDRVDRMLMQVFGVNPSLLSAGSNSQPYASSALQAEFMNQILRTYQGYLKDHFKERAEVVAEAQGHYDYDKKGDTRVPIMERVKATFEDVDFWMQNGRQCRVLERFDDYALVEVHKLLVPELDMAVLDMRDEATERNFLLQLRSMGVPIADDKLMVGVAFEWKDSLDTMSQEMVTKIVAQQQAKQDAYDILVKKGLPVPPELAAEIAAQAGAAGAVPPPADGQNPGPHAQTPGSPMVLPDAPGEVKGLMGGDNPTTPAVRPEDFQGPVPEVSNERRKGLQYNTHVEDGDLPPPVPRPTKGD
jgi:hypothetical protein